MPSLDVIALIPGMNGNAKAKDVEVLYTSIVEKWASIKNRFQNVTGRKIKWVMRNGLECDLNKDLDFFMHGFGKLKPPWVLVLEPVEIFFVFVSFGSREFHIGVFPNQTVGQLKKDLMIKFNVPVHTQRLVFDGAQMKDERELADYRLKRDDRIECKMRLPGGGFVSYTKYFVDVSRSDLMTKVDTFQVPPDYPRWRCIHPGLNLEGKCTNFQCPAASDEASTRAHMRYGTFDVILQKCACPECDTNFQPTTCGFHYCEWSFFGIKMVNDEPQSVEGPWKTVPSGKYHYFDDELRGSKVKWARLLLTARPAQFLHRKCLLCNEALEQGTKFEAPCGHVFHDSCWMAYSTLRSQQDVATGGVLCPICRTNVPKTYAQQG